MNAYLLLANGMVFAGQSVGAEGVTVGEVVFATGMVGFEETLTDPSYYGQIITQTLSPHRQLRHEQGRYGVGPHLGQGCGVREVPHPLQLALWEETLTAFEEKYHRHRGHRHTRHLTHHPGERCDERCHPDHL